jgi:hypothetical protein
MSETRKSNLLGKITVVVVICCCCLSAQAKYGGGSGISNDPYLIYDANQLKAIGANPGDWDKHFLMTTDIDLITLQGEDLIIDSQIITSPYFLDFDSQHQMLYWSDRAEYSIWRKDMNSGEMEKIISTGDWLSGIAIDYANGKLYWIADDRNATYHIYGSNLDGSNIVEILNRSDDFYLDLKIDPIQQKLYWSSSSLTPKIFRVNVDGSGFEEIVTMSYSSTSYSVYLALDTIGGKIYFFETNGPTLQRCNLDGSSKEILISSGLDHPRNLVLDNANSRLYWTDYGIDRILSSNLDGTDQRYLTYQSPNPRGIALDSEQGKIYYSEIYYSIIRRINLDGSSSETVCENYFRGVFDGNDFTVRNFINNYESPKDMVGLFGVIGNGAEIRNLNLECDLTVSNSDYAGGLVGVSIYGDITNCHVDGNIVSLSDTHTGGLVGSNGGTITNCSANISVQSNGIAGGLVGSNTYHDSPYDYDGIIRNSCSAGSVSGTNRVGGLVGLNSTFSKIYNSYSDALVVGGQYVGGLVGLSAYYTRIFSCYSSGHVSGTLDTGGFVGYVSNNARVENCFWDVTTSDHNESAAGTGLTTDLMYQQQTYFDWICEQVWTIDDDNDYPRLYWQEMPGILLPLPTYGGGKGTENEPYLIYTAKQLATIGLVLCQLDCHYRLMSDINLSVYSGDTFPIIGYDQEAFTGVFDGMGHTIQCFTYQSENFPYDVGLFGKVDDFGQIKNLTLIDPNVVTPQARSAGSLVGNLRGIFSTLSNCAVRGASVTGRNAVGGLAGHSFGNIIQCSSEGVIIGNSSLGGLLGFNAGYIEKSYSDSLINGNIHVGGLIGYNVKYPEPWSDHVYISDSYSSGRVQAVEAVGGFVGRNNASMRNCWTAAAVQGQTSVGGFVGEIFGAYGVEASESCFWDVNVNPNLEGIGTGEDPNIIGLPKTEMQIPSTFIESGWDFVGETQNGFVDIWRMCQNGVDYPRLKWEFNEFGDLTCPDGVDFFDYSVLAYEWQLKKLQQDYNHDGGIDFKDFSSYASGWGGDYSKLLSFCSLWLSRSATGADIAPIPGDEIVDWQDLFLLCENWLIE